ncbi:MAG: hypothetical protein AAB399_02045 [Patescibacteria group bacterium]
MKTVFANIVLIALISISVFGFVGLSEMHGAMGNNCFADATQGTPCPVKDGVFAFAAFHFKNIQNLSQSGFLDVSPLFLFSALLSAFSLALIFSEIGKNKILSQTYFRKNYEDRVADSGPKMISWFAGLERSPAFAIGA